MPSDHHLPSDRCDAGSSIPSDDFLIGSLLGGDSAALVKLMDRYDRLVRYTIFRAARERCVRDPLWLESIASATWAGFVQSMQRHPNNRPRSLSTYLARIARNRTVSALRNSAPVSESISAVNGAESLLIAFNIEEPVEEVGKLELLEALRVCLTTLDEADRAIMSQLVAIMERRWEDAAITLGMKESTLRSRWKRTLERLRTCLEGKNGGEIAPAGLSGDRMKGETQS